MNWVYIIRCEDGSYYTGWSTDPVHRFHVHKAGKGVKYTRSHHPIALVYAQCYDTKKKAMAQEYAVKQKTHKEKEKLMESMPDDVEQYVRTLERRRKFMEGLKIYRCRKCGKIVIMVYPSGCPTMCCGEEMELLKPNTVDAAVEKHVPVVTRENNKVTVSIGSTPHPMIPEHYIEFIVLQSAKGFRVAYLNPGDAPCVDFLDDEPATAVYAYCNLHGLWKTES